MSLGSLKGHRAASTELAEVSCDASYPFFCTCAELAVVSRQRKKKIKSDDYQAKVILFILPLNIILVRLRILNYLLILSKKKAMKILLSFALIMMTSLSFYAQKATSFEGKLDGLEIKASINLLSGESSGSFFFITQPKEIYELNMVNKTDSKIEIKIIHNGNKFASGMLNQSEANGIIQLSGEITKADGEITIITLVEAN